MFGNYAVGGAIDFRMRTGEQINGFEVGTDAGSFGYLNNYMIVGKKSGDWDVSLFASNVKGDGYIFHTGYDIETVNMLTTWSPTNSDRVTFNLFLTMSIPRWGSGSARRISMRIRFKRGA